MSRDEQSNNTMESELAPESNGSGLPLRQIASGNTVVNANHTQAPNTQYRSRPVTVAVDPVSLVISECISVTSAMRKHARWAGSSVSSILGGNPNPIQLGPPSPLLRPGSKGSMTSVVGEDFRWGLRGKRGKSMQDNPLMAGFGRLRHELSSCKDIHEFDAPALLNPFLQVIQASSTSAPITILALKAIRKFLSYGFISPSSPRFPLAMQSLSTAITHCRFEASDSAQDEVVLLMILHLMEDMLSGPGGALLSDESVCEMMETGLTMCCQSRLSELLRRTAEAAMVRMCQIIFEHLKHLEVEAGDDLEALDNQANGDMEGVKMVPSTNGNDVIASSDAPAGEPRESSGSENTANGDERSTRESSESDDDSMEIKPYSLPSMKELFRVLVDLLDPHDKQQGDTMRVMALRIIHVALEVAGPSIARHPALAVVAEDRLCRHLFQLVRSDNMAILQESLIVAGTLLETCRGVLKLQQELFLSYLIACLHPPVDIPREPNIDPSLYDGIPQRPSGVKPPPSQAGSGRSTPVPVKDRQKLGMEGGARKPDARQAMVESVGALTRMPSFLVELFVNYDSDANRGNLCEDMIGLLSRSALPDSATWSTTSVPPLCLDALLGFVQSIADRLDDAPVSKGLPDQATLREERRRKKMIIKGATKFNEKPKEGLGYLKEQGIITSDPVSIAKFLRSTSRVSKAVLGEFLSKKGNDEYLEAFLDLFDFSGKRVDEAVRLLLESFRLPGESALIERIVTTFAKKYFATSGSDVVLSEDAVFILTYAIIMLNVDQHSPKLKGQRRMELVDFARNLRGVNNTKDFPPEFLEMTFEAIKSNEIILPDEHENKHAFDYAWRELLLKTESAGPLALCDTNIYDADMFATTWKPIVSTLSYVFMSATDDAVFSRVVTGFDQCSQIASRYGITEALDRIIQNLSYMTTLDTDGLSNTSLNTEVKIADDSDTVMVSELSVKLGRDFKAQLATLVLFRVVKGSEHVIRNGWQQIIRIWVKLFVNSLIPSFNNDPEKLKLPKIPVHTPSQVIDRAAKTADTGLFSALSSYISSYAADDPPEPSAEEVESSLSTADCIKACDLESVFTNISALPADSLSPLIKALLDELPDDESSAVPVITVKPDSMPSSPASASKPASRKPTYDPAVVYILEFCTVLALRDNETVELLGKPVAEALQMILRDSPQHHPILVSRVACYQFSILKDSYDHDFVRAPVLLHAISSFPKEILAKTSQLVLQGLKHCIDQPGPLRSEIMTSPDFWVILRTLAGNANASPTVFEILEGGVSGSPSAIIADNYEAAIALLNEYATAAKVGALVEQKGERRQRNARPPKKEVSSDNAVVSRGVKAVNIISAMTARIPHLMKQSHLENSEAWSAYWLPIFQALTTQCTNPCREVRSLAFSSLQRSLLSPELTCSDHEEWTAIFGEVLFPLILRLLKPEVYSSDRDGMSETRVQAASLLCKTFLQYLVLLSKWDGMLDLWLKIIDIMDRLMNSGQGDSLEEAVPENLKNVLLFMSSSGYLVPPSKDPSQEKLWVETWKRIDRFLPDLRNELALEEPEEPEEPEAPQEDKQPQAEEPIQEPVEEEKSNNQEEVVAV
ncbi:hypothetical protein F4677DRAFT_401922 [Hypoxylon crocopeplum]|nr:hypothetical protein F4677DRAFT_401922 [Hypoxylon crocopeplum]